MDNVENLVRTALGEIEKVLSTRTVVGEPITVDGATLIPLISVGFGFGAGGGEGKGETKQRNEGTGTGTGGGAWVRPIGIVIVKDGSVTVEPVKSGLSNAVEKIGQTVPELMEKAVEKALESWREKKKEE